jgi:histone acetyltransferase (RNA polymerase elongator complex component)
MRHKNIPVFIPHLGCPNDCVFCNQRVISGTQVFREEDVKAGIDEAVAALSPGDEAEIAFFGGSFTGIDRGLMTRLLELAAGYVRRGKVKSVRCSTRPDYIDAEVLSVLSGYGVGTVELGIQSVEDRVLAACRRGHTAADSGRACRLVTEAGFRLVGQMMIGLPASSPADEVRTAEAICDWGACAARVYPTVIFCGTELSRMAKDGRYRPLGADEAVSRTADVLEVFDRRGIPVIRVGLCAGEGLSSAEDASGGTSHPAMGELAMSEVFYRRIAGAVDGAAGTARSRSADGGLSLLVEVPKGAVSKAAGHGRRNIRRLLEKYSADPGINRVKILENPGLIGYNIRISFI